MTRVYLAGPEVFLPDAQAIGAAKVALCAECDLEGLFPLDAELNLSAGEPRGKRTSQLICEANLALIDSAGAVIANLTPFRGVSADVGTVFEVAYAIGRSIPVFAYSNVETAFDRRVIAAFGDSGARDGLGRKVAGDGMAIESFEQTGPAPVDNLMIDEAIRAQGWEVICRTTAPEARFSDLSAFRACLKQMMQRRAGVRVEHAA